MKTILFFILTVFVLSAFSQSNTNAEIKLTLRDGSIFNGQASLKNISLDTKYGKLLLPFQNVSYIEVGITPNKANESKIAELITKLTNESEAVRKAAYEEIVGRPINDIPVINDYLYSEKYTASTYTDYTPEAAFEELKAKYNLTNDFKSEDVVSIDYQYLMGGTYEFKNIDIKTEYGTLSIPKEKINRIDVIYVPGENQNSQSYILQASKHISGNTAGGWLKTGVMLKKGQRFSINASGEVTLQSLSGGKYNPDGAVGAGNYGVDDYDYSGVTNTYPQYGNLVYKIGENGTMMKAGSKINGNANETGVLYFSIYETVYNAANTGMYKVNVTVNQ